MLWTVDCSTSGFVTLSHRQQRRLAPYLDNHSLSAVNHHTPLFKARRWKLSALSERDSGQTVRWWAEALLRFVHPSEDLTEGAAMRLLGSALLFSVLLQAMVRPTDVITEALAANAAVGKADLGKWLRVILSSVLTKVSCLKMLVFLNEIIVFTFVLI